METEIITKSILHQLGIGKSYSGYDYVRFALYLIEQNESLLSCITKSLYFDIAKEYHTSDICVERNIRKVIEIIWKNRRINKVLIIKIFGRNFLKNKPSNKEFLELLYEYVKSYNLFSRLIDVDNIICPVSHDVCIAYTKIINHLTDI